MAIDLAPVRTKLQSELESITNVKRAHKYTPRGLSAANCPQWLIQPAEAIYELEMYTGTQAVIRASRRWRLVLLTASAISGAYGDMEKGLESYFALVENELVTNLKLGGLTDVDQATVVSDSGMIIVPFPPSPLGGNEARWFGCEWEMIVRSSRVVTFPDSLISTGSTVRARLADVLASITGINRALDYSPKSEIEANAPCFLIYETSAEHSSPFADGYTATRVWRLILLVGKAKLGMYGTMEAALDPFFERVPDILSAYLTMNGMSGIVKSVLTDDTGPGIIEFPPGSGSQWLGCEWDFEVEPKRGVTVGL